LAHSGCTWGLLLFSESYHFEMYNVVPSSSLDAYLSIARYKK